MDIHVDGMGIQLQEADIPGAMVPVQDILVPAPYRMSQKTILNRTTVHQPDLRAGLLGCQTGFHKPPGQPQSQMFSREISHGPDGIRPEKHLQPIGLALKARSSGKVQDSF